MNTWAAISLFIVGWFVAGFFVARALGLLARESDRAIEREDR